MKKTLEIWVKYGLSKTYPSLQLLNLLPASLHGDLFCLIKAVLQVLNGLLHVLLHALHVCLDC